MNYKGLPVNVYVDIIGEINKNGKIRPMTILWEDGREFPIAKINRVISPHLSDGSDAICYECVIKGKQKDLYTKDGRWFVIVDKPIEL